MKYWVKSPAGKQYTPLQDSSGIALALATNKRLGRPNCKTPPKNGADIWDQMKREGFALETFAARDDWRCPWDICNHEQARECRAESHPRKGCGGRFPAEMTVEQAKQEIGRSK